MKFTDWIVEKFGNDKIMHFLGGAWITSLFSPFGWIGIIIGIVLTLILSLIKEQYLDSEFDFKDIIAASMGSLTSILLYWVIFVII